jgi:preprotein translocase subunit SecF
MTFGAVLVGSYTSIFIAAPILIYLGVGHGRDVGGTDTGEEAETPAAAAKPSKQPAPAKR